MTTRTDEARLVNMHVARVVSLLQGGYLPSGTRPRASSESVQRLALLRRADPARPAADPRIWEVTLAGIPEELLADRRDPSTAERAVHAALALYAVHQQSQPQPMHVPGRSLGRAAGELARRRTGGSELDKAVLRRFQSVATATGPGQRLYFLRSLVTLLRSEDIPLDYARLASDLYWLEVPGRADRIRMDWGRDLHRRGNAETDGRTTAVTTSERAGTNQ